MLLNRILACILCFGFFTNLYSQKGKDGVKSITTTTATTKVNEFTDLKADALVGATTISVSASTLNANLRFPSALSAGDLIMIYQTQGAMMNLGTYAQWWQPDSTYGKVWNYANSGNLEFAQVKSIISATQIELGCGLKYSYSSIGKTQIVRVPRYSSLNIAASATLTTDAWNGTIGGILAVEVDGNTTINAGGLVSANALGFRGGVPIGNGGTGNSNFVTKNPSDGAEKGEGIGSHRLLKAAATTTATPDSLGYQCKGAPANGGGGGNSNNCGGGGGGNAGNTSTYIGYGVANTTYSVAFNLEFAGRANIISSGGGKGGYGTSTVIANPNVNGPHNAIWSSSFKRPSYGGFGGRPLDYSTGKIFMGGGGGAGHTSGSQSNAANACAGGNGGGIIYFLNYGTISGSGTISSNGANGNNATGNPSFGSQVQGIDGAGGGGGGGTIILESVGSVSSITGNANGGNGGNQTITLYSNASINYTASTNEGQGPGGGGGGGYIASNGSAFTQNINGGINGITNATAFDTEFPMNGATSGNVGLSNQLILGASNLYTVAAVANPTICVSQSVTVSVTTNAPSPTIDWYSSIAGGTPLLTGSSTYTTPVYSSAGTYTVFANVCPGLYRVPVIIKVNPTPTVSVANQTICPAQTITLTASGAITYTWSTSGSPTTNTVAVSPTVTTVYAVSGTSNTCTSSTNVTVTVNSPTLAASGNTAICSGNSTTLTASGTGITSYTWMPGGQLTATVSVSPSSTQAYTVTGSNGTCTNTTVITVSVTSTPTLTAVSPATICVGQVATFTTSGATNYTWSPGNVTGSTFTLSPASSTPISVIGANGSCTTQVTSGLTVNAVPSITVANQSICPNQTAILTATGATTYTWSTAGSPTTNTLAVTPTITTTYTVNGTTNSCTSTKTVVVTVNSQPTLAVTGNTAICSGSSTTLTANGTGVTNYTWMPGGQPTATVTLSPASTQTYIVTGSNGTCTNTTAVTVSVTTTPTLTAPSATVCSGQTTTLTVSGAASFTWNPGNVIASTYTVVNPTSTTTVSVIGSNGNCLSAQQIVTVSIGAAASISVPPATICPGQSTTLTASPATSYTWSTGSFTNTTIVSPTITTTYSVSGTIGSCAGTGTVEVTVISQPTLSVTGNANICSGNTTTLSVSGSANNYTWMPGAQPSTSIAVTPTSTAIYSVTGSNGFCSTTITATVNVTQTPTLIPVSATICPSQTATLSVSDVSGTASFTWTPGAQITSSVVVTPTINTTYTITGAIGTCTAQTTASVDINSIFAMPIAGTTTICPNQTTTLTASGATSYTWNTGAITASISVSPTITTTYTVDGTFGSCPGTSTVEVVVAGQPTFAVTGNTAICSGNSSTLTASGSATSFTWMPGSITTVSISANATTDYTITGSDGTCTNTLITSFSVTPTPTLSAQSLTICTGETATITASGATTYTWNPGNITGNVYTTTSAGPVTMIGANGTCTTQTTHSVTIGSALSVAVNSETICAGQTVVLTATTSAASYSWTTGATTNSISVSPSTSTEYTIYVASGTCTGSNTAMVTVNSVPSLTVTPASTNICAGQTATLIASGTVTYTWNPGSLNGNTQTVSPVSLTIYTVSGTSLAGCTNTAIATTTVNVTSIPNVNITISPSSTICAGQTATLTAIGAPNYLWSTGATTSSIIVSPSALTSYTVVGDDNGCSSLPAIAMVDVAPLPTLIAAASNTTGCPGLCVQFTDFVFPTTSTISYNFGDGTFGNTNNPQYCYPVSGNYTVTVTASDPGFGCSTTYTVANIITITPGPIADFTIEEGNVVTAGSVVNLTNTSTNAANSAWDFGNGAFSPFTNANTTYADTGNYCITLFVANGTCTNSATKCLDVVKEATINIPNVFTPNGDGSNELFKITGTGIKNLDCSIFDRWGLKLYEWNGINGSWDGNVKSGEASAGTYFYIINYTDLLDKSTTEKGFLNLFRN